MGFDLTNKIWKKDEIAALITLFETERCLYDMSDIDFHDVNKNREAYERICKIMLRIRSDVSVEEIKYKIKVLRKQYEGELLHRNISIEAGLCPTKPYKPGMWCFGLLQFLDDHITVKTVDEKSKNNKESDKESYIPEKDYQKDAEESSDVADESYDHEEIEERITCKKRKVESLSSSGREPLKLSIRKLLSSSSEKYQSTSFSVKKFQSSSSVQNKLKNSSSSSRKCDSNSSSGKKFQSQSLTKKSQDISSSYEKFQNSLSSKKKNSISSSLKKAHSVSPSERNTPRSSNSGKGKKHDSERELENSSFDNESKKYSEKDIQTESSSESDAQHSSSTVRETKINSLDRDLFNASFSGNKFDVIENRSQENSIDREDIFGRYVASELRALRRNPLLYLQTKQFILENLNSANFELINPE